jgi:cytochrome c-type biogenesis protein CcmE
MDNWEKTPELAEKIRPRRGQRRVYLFAGIALIAVVGYLIFSGLGSRYYMTVDEVLAEPDENLGKNIRLTGAVVGDYQFDQQTGTLYFVVAHIPRDNDEIRDAGGLDAVLAAAVDDPNRQQIQVIYEDAEIPDLLQNKAQAIMTGHLELNSAGEYVFYAEELNLKCPSRHSDEGEEAVDEAA